MAPGSQVENGYILIARKLGNSFLMECPPLWIKLWIWMLLNARFRDGDKLKRGQLLATIEEMRDAMVFYVGYRKKRPTRDQIRSAYEAFVKALMITTTKTTRGMIITICNYDKYQNPKNYEAHSEPHDEDTAKPTVTPHDTEERKKKEKNVNIEEPNGSLSTECPVDGKISNCPHGQIIQIYHEELPSLAHIQIWNESSKQHLKARWREDRQRQCLQYWQELFNYISKSDFLMGRKNEWQADLHWIVKASNFAKIVNGAYHQKKSFHDRLKRVGEQWLQEQREKDSWQPS